MMVLITKGIFFPVSFIHSIPLSLPHRHLNVFNHTVLCQGAGECHQLHVPPLMVIWMISSFPNILSNLWPSHLFVHIHIFVLPGQTSVRRAVKVKGYAPFHLDRYRPAPASWAAIILSPGHTGEGCLPLASVKTNLRASHEGSRL